MLNLAGSSNQKQLTQFRHGPDLANPMCTQAALADKSALHYHIEEQQSTSKQIVIVYWHTLYVLFLYMYCTCIALIKEKLPDSSLRRSNSVIFRRRPASTSSETGKQPTTGISSELQKQLEKRRKWEKNEDSQATNKTEILTHQSQQQTNAGKYI